jgi:hypothetical protein
MAMAMRVTAAGSRTIRFFMLHPFSSGAPGMGRGTTSEGQHY